MRMLFCLVTVVSLPLLAGCSGGDFPTAKVNGRVVCEGKPIANLVVFFEPISSGDSALVGKQGIGRTAEDGTFQISTYGRNDGAVVGKHRVRVGWSDDFVDPNCPGEINSEKDVMHVEVKKGEKNEFEVDVPKKTANSTPTLDELESLEEAEDEDD